MCFSTVASFGAGAILSGVSIIAARNVDKPEQWAFAAIPGIFAVQQFTEGFVWLSLSVGSMSAWNHAATFMFLVFAQVVWPMWVPFAVLLLEKDRWRRQILMILMGLGLILSSHTLYCLVAYPLESRISEYHIQYSLGFPAAWLTVIGLTYGLVTIVPTFISTVPKMSLIGLMIAGSYVLTRVFFPDYLLSVWCFFAAIISGIVVKILLDMRKAVSPSF